MQTAQTTPTFAIDPTIDEIVQLKAARALDDRALRTIFYEARTANGFVDRPVPRDLLTRAVDIALLGPTGANSLPLRIVFVETPEAKERLRPAMSPTNVDKTMAAPVNAIIAADLQFYDQFTRTFPERAEMYKGVFSGLPIEAQRGVAWDNAVLQMGYFIIALRSVGLDAGPMGGFERSIVDAAFFPDGQFVAQYVINIGYGDDTKSFPRLPRFNVDEIARFA
jgi:3-hydroxypropanoate dehydrogenase